MPFRLADSWTDRTPARARAVATALRWLAIGGIGWGAAAGALAQVDRTAAPPPPAADVQVQLIFGGRADLDLFVTDPLREEVYFANSPSRLGGVFEADRRCGDPAPRIETVRFSPAPAGRYRVSVDFPIRCEPGVDEAPYLVIVDAGGGRTSSEGTARFGRLERIVLEFEVPAPE